MKNEKFSYIVNAVSTNVKHLGEKQTILALKAYMTKNYPNGFTRQEMARENILKVDSKEIEKIMGMPAEPFVKQFIKLDM